MYFVILTNLILMFIVTPGDGSTAICQGHGDPHYTTWDTAFVDYQGLCRHLLAGVCGPTQLEPWTVISNNVMLGPFVSYVSVSEYVEVTVYGRVVRMDAYAVITVDSLTSALDYISLESATIIVTRSLYGELELTTDFGLIVRQFGYTSTVIAPSAYANNVCGICGDWNGVTTDDYGRNLTAFQQPESATDPDCTILNGSPFDNCTERTIFQAEQKCRELFSQQGFDDCKDLPKSPIEAFINNCIMDICGGGDPTVVSCDTLDALVELCEELTGEQIKNLTSECDDDEGNGDPHFIVTSHDQYHTKLCYDVNGNDGDVLLVIRDEDTKLEINGEIYGTKDAENPKAYFSNFAIFYKDMKVMIDRTDIKINDDESFHWTESFKTPLDDDNKYFVSSDSALVVEVELASDIHVRVTRTQRMEGDYYLGIMLIHTNGLGYHTTGVMGSFLKSSFNVVSSTDNKYMLEFLDRSLSIPVQKVKRRSRVSPTGKVDCWHYSVKTDEMHDDLLGDRSSYTVPTIDYKPF